MKVTVLGCGSSAGTPSVEAGWGKCDPNNPKNRRTRPSILVEDGDKRVLVDTSPDLREQLLPYLYTLAGGFLSNRKSPILTGKSDRNQDWQGCGLELLFETPFHYGSCGLLKLFVNAVEDLQQLSGPWR